MTFKPDKKMIKGHIAIFGITAALILLALILTGVYTKHFVHPVGQWFLAIALSIGLVIATYAFCYRDDYGTTEPSKGLLYFSWVFYIIVLVGSGTVVRTNRVEECTPKHSLALTGVSGQGTEWVNWYQDCPNADFILDQPAKDFIVLHNTLPSWLMFKNGITPDPVGWWKYYANAPNNPYDLSKVNQAEFYSTRQLPKEVLNP